MKKTTRFNLILALAAALMLTALAGAGAFRRADKWVQDSLLQRPGLLSPDIVIIGIDEESITRLGPYQSWDRSVMASALEALAADPEALPAVVAVDALYTGETGEADQMLTAAAEKLPHVITASKADFGTAYELGSEGRVVSNPYTVLGYETAYEALRAATVQGHINVMYDQDGIMRHGILYADVPETAGGTGGRVYSLAFEAARIYLEEKGITIREPEVNARGQFYIPFSGKPGDYLEGYSLARLISGEISPSVWAGKIVLIGPCAAALQDAYFTPISRSAAMYGVELHANVIQSFLEGNHKTEVSDLLQLAVLFAVSFLLAMVLLRGRLKRTVWAAAAVAIAGPAAALLLYQAGYVIHPLWLPAAALILLILAVIRHYALAALEKQRVTRTFERYVAPEIVQEILRDGTESLGLGGNLCRIAVLFVDIRGFTALSERLPPQKVVWILNQYLAMTSDCVTMYQGTLDKFVGDATMAFWGAPLPAKDPAGQAVRAALEIRKRAEELFGRLKGEIGEELRVGIGVHLGPAIVGNMGSERRMDYTAIGDTVNTAARLEANAPGGTIYVSRAVADELGSRAAVTSLGDSVRLKGKAEGFEVLILHELRE